MYRALILASSLCAVTASLQAQDAKRWRAHDTERPRPRVVTPGASAGQPPSDAIVLFNGTNLDAWTGADGRPARWTVRDGYMETAPGAGPVMTKRGFGDVQLHVEWATPSRVQGTGQGRGNSGVIIMGLYEVQVLDSYNNQTYADGQAAALYGQYPPLVNASRGPGEWQTYDIVFRRPRFGRDGRMTTPARVTVLHNGVLVQDAETLWGPTQWLQHGAYKAHPDSLPLVLQDHDNPVRYRNIWLRPLGDIARPSALASAEPAVQVPPSVLRGYAGKYVSGRDEVATVELKGARLVMRMPGDPRDRELVLIPITSERFNLMNTFGTVTFAREGAKQKIRLQFAEIDRTGERQ